jgi:hypothetical protein
MQGRWLLDPAPLPKPMWIGNLSFVFSLMAMLPNEVRKDAGASATVALPLLENPSRSGSSAQPTRWQRIVTHFA